jgi:hypothetical protein
MNEREMSTIASSQKSRCGLGEMLADDGRVAYLPVALRQLEAGEADGARVVSRLGVLQPSAVERDRTRLIAARRREPSVEAPECREASGGNRVAECVGRSAEGRRGLIEVVLQQPGFSKRRSDGELVFAWQPGRAESRCKQLCRFRTSAAFERRT